LFNKKKFRKLLEKREWDYEINLLEDIPKDFNTKVYIITVEKNAKIVVEKITQDRTYSKIKLEIYYTIFLHPKERKISMISTRLQKVELVHNKR